jgi:hypothetical protein
MKETTEIWEDHPALYHYTTEAGLRGIIDSQSIHATHYAFMNDYKEMHAFEARLEQLMVARAKKLFEGVAKNEAIRKRMEADGGIDGLARHDAAAIVRAMYRITFGLDGGIKFLQPFIVSFCGHKEKYVRENGLLSQWRCYGKDSGYAIVFDAKALNDARLEEMSRYHYDLSGIGDVFYEKDEETFRNEFEEMAKAIDIDLPKVLRGDKGPYNELINAFQKSVSRYKHEAFFEEQEVRLIFSPTDDKLLTLASKKGKEPKPKEKKFVRYRANLAPYISLFEAPDIELPITRIIVGPHADRGLRKTRLQKYLDLQGLEIEVSWSQTPVAL